MSTPRARIGAFTRRDILQAIGAASAGAACAPGLAAVRPGYRLVNAMPQLFKLLDGSADTQQSTLVARFRAEIIAAHAEVYGFFGAYSDRVLGRYLADVATRAARQREQSAGFPAAFADTWASFVAAMPRTGGEATTVHLLPASHEMMGGAVRALGARDFVALGSEEMFERVDDRRALSTYLDHELTHLCHNQNNPEMRSVTETFFLDRAGPKARLYQLMWLEGLAAHASKMLNPDASVRDVLLSDDLPARVAARWPQLVEGVRRNFDATDPNIIGAYVFNGDEAQHMPKSAAYYLGMRLADELAKHHDVRDLIILRGEALRSALLHTLQQLTPF